MITLNKNKKFKNLIKIMMLESINVHDNSNNNIKYYENFYGKLENICKKCVTNSEDLPSNSI